MAAEQVDMLLAGLVTSSGAPLASGKVYTYVAGTSTETSLYTAQDKSAVATNPIVLDSLGRATVYGDGTYKFVVKTSADVTVSTHDNLSYGTLFTTGSTGNVNWCGSSSNVSNAYSVSVAGYSSYTAGDVFQFIVNATNTGAATLDVSAAGVKNIKRGDGTADLVAGDLLAGDVVEVVYDTTSPGFFHLVARGANKSLLGDDTGVDIRTLGNNDITFATSNSARLILGNSAQALYPNDDEVFDLGTTSKAFGKLYVGNQCWTKYVASESGQALDVGTYGADVLYFITNNTRRAQFKQGAVEFAPVADNACDLGDGSLRFKDLYLSGRARGFVKAGTWDPDWAVGGGSLSSIANYITYWYGYGKKIDFQIHASFTTTAASGELTAKLPSATADWYASGSGFMGGSVQWRNPAGSGTWKAGVVLISDNTAASSRALTIHSYDGLTIVGGASCEVVISGWYEEV